MKAVLCTRHGPPEALELVDLPDPVAGPGEAVVDVVAVGLNFFDTLIIRNMYQHKPQLPFSPGGEFSGVVSAVGPDVTGVSVGDRVCGRTICGAAREKLVIQVDRLARVPDGFNMMKAAALIITYATSLYALRDRGALQPGESLAVLGASGGVGLAAVELGKVLGARVMACASSKEKVDFALAHGADAGLDYSKEDLKAGLKAWAGEKGLDMIYDPVGGDQSEASLRALGVGGRLMVIGFASGTIPKLPLNLLLLKNCDARGVAYSAKAESDPTWMKATIEELLGYAAAERISVHVDDAFPLVQCAQALGEIAERRVKGKVVLTTGLIA